MMMGLNLYFYIYEFKYPLYSFFLFKIILENLLIIKKALMSITQETKIKRKKVKRAKINFKII